AAAAGAVVGLVALVAAPAQVEPAASAGGDEVDLLVRVLADVGDPEVACERVEGDAPRVAQAQRIDLVAAGSAGAVGIGVVGRDAVVRARGQAAVGRAAAAGAVDIDAQQLAQQAVRVLGVVVWIATAAAVARGAGEVAVRAELDVTAVVVAVGLLELHQNQLGGRVGDVGIAADGEARDAGAVRAAARRGP